jgi:hypothetical protein
MQAMATRGKRIVAVDWSGRGGAEQSRHIWLCEIVDGEVQRLESGRTRQEIVDELSRLAEADADVVVGLDFAFSVPAWYLAERGLAAAPELWELLVKEALTPKMQEVGLRAWIQEPEWPFWRTGRPADLTPERAFRRTELEAVAPGTQPKSVFQLVGGGQVGPGSLYGMQALHELSRRGFSVWPFELPSGPFAVEIFPRILTGVVVKSDGTARKSFLNSHDLLPAHRAAAEGSEDAFDTLVSALIMAQSAQAFDQLEAETEYALEGKIWTAPGSASAQTAKPIALPPVQRAADTPVRDDGLAPAPQRYDWARLSKLQVGRYGDYYAKMELTLFGFDVYGAEVDDKGIDFVIRRGVDRFYDVQVKTVRLPEGNYVFFRKKFFELRDTLLATLILLRQHEPPQAFLIPSLAWHDTDALLCSMDYEGKKSEPEWGMRLSARNLPLLERFSFEEQVTHL